MGDYPGLVVDRSRLGDRLFVGGTTREHEDVVILVLRWAGSNRGGGDAFWSRSGLWARSEPDGPRQLEALLAEADGDARSFRLEPSIRLPLAETGLSAGRQPAPLSTAQSPPRRRSGSAPARAECGASKRESARSHHGHARRAGPDFERGS